MNVDVLTDMNLEEMIDQHKKLNPLATLAVTSTRKLPAIFYLMNAIIYVDGKMIKPVNKK